MTPFEEWIDSRWRDGMNTVVANKANMRPKEMKDCPEPWRTLFVVTTGFSGEAGEVVEHVKKLVRDGKFDRQEFLIELGDQHHYWVKLCHLFGFTQTEVEGANMIKLEARDLEGKL